MVAQNSAAERTLEVPIDALPRVYWAIASTSRSTEAEWKELSAARLSASCIACGMKISGTELRQLGPAYADEAPDNQKLERLRLGYCARNTCQSRYYRVHIQPDSELHWTGIKGQLIGATPEIRETKPPRAPIRLPRLRLDRLRSFHLLALITVGVILFFVVRSWVYGYRIPVVQKKNEYKIIQAPE